MNINNGHNAKFWIDIWVNNGPLLELAIRNVTKMELDLLVASFCNEFGG